MPPLLRNMSDLKPQGTRITLGTEQYGLLFSLNAIDDIQDLFDIDISELTSLFHDKVEDDKTIPNRNKTKNLREMLAILINEWIAAENDLGRPAPKPVDARFVGRHITAANWASMYNEILNSFRESTPEREEDDIPNAASE
jgi:hypothetical protein